MIRDIRFRAYHIQQKKMYQVSAIDWARQIVTVQHSDDAGHDEGVLTFPMSECELLEFTGMQDSAGLDIYEGTMLDDMAVCLQPALWAHSDLIGAPTLRIPKKWIRGYTPSGDMILSKQVFRGFDKDWVDQVTLNKQGAMPQ